MNRGLQFDSAWFWYMNMNLVNSSSVSDSVSLRCMRYIYVCDFCQSFSQMYPPLNIGYSLISFHMHDLKFRVSNFDWHIKRLPSLFIIFFPNRGTELHVEIYIKFIQHLNCCSVVRCNLCTKIHEFVRKTFIVISWKYHFRAMVYSRIEHRESTIVERYKSEAEKEQNETNQKIYRT